MKNILKYDVIFYLLQSDGQVRRSSSEHNFGEGVKASVGSLPPVFAASKRQGRERTG